MVLTWTWQVVIDNFSPEAELVLCTSLLTNHANWAAPQKHQITACMD
jgi:hypothetical protein